MRSMPRGGGSASDAAKSTATYGYRAVSIADRAQVDFGLTRKNNFIVHVCPSPGCADIGGATLQRGIRV